MKMIARLRYLLAEGFEVGNVSGYDATSGTNDPGCGSITYVITKPDGSRRLITEEFQLTPGEAKRCSLIYLRWLQ
jgi:hypothetical protein